jgi:Domain of unknown function (DUF4432)
MLGEGTYAVGLEPSTNRDAGRFDARDRGELQWLEPGQIRRYDLEIGALAGAEAIAGFETRVSRLQNELQSEPESELENDEVTTRR